MTEKSNHKWRERKLDSEELLEIEEALNEQFRNQIAANESITVDGWFTKDEELFLNFLFKNEEETFYYPFETSISVKDNSESLTPTDAKLVLADFITGYLDEYFANERDCFVLIDWTEYKFKNLKLNARGQVFNKRLDYEADELLKAAGFNQYGEEIKKH